MKLSYMDKKNFKIMILMIFKIAWFIFKQIYFIILYLFTFFIFIYLFTFIYLFIYFFIFIYLLLYIYLFIFKFTKFKLFYRILFYQN